MRDLQGTQRTSGLVDLLDRVLDKGLVIAGDVKISLAEVELLTIRVRLLVCSVDKAEQIGLDWWRHDKHLSGTGKGLLQENEALREQVRRLEARVASLGGKALEGRARPNGSDEDGAGTRKRAPRSRGPGARKVNRGQR
ncbi:MAG: gas vesicle protein [Planctomycetes bacterium]|nr:gas vesicle protein [Planctomycetota bacterium]